MFRVLCAPDKFKGTLTAQQAAQAMCRGAMRAGGDVQAEACPVADGGEGTLEILLSAPRHEGHEIRQVRVMGPLGEQVTAQFGLTSGIKSLDSIIELAQAAGLGLVPASRRDPTKTTTFGVGEMILAASEAGARAHIVCLGGSATVDGGCGIAQALGVKFFDHAGRAMTQPMTGGMLQQIACIKRPRPRKLPALFVLHDVMNPLLGEDGAARTYAAQKGATPEQIEQLEAGLANLAAITGGDPNVPGAGAAGGAGYGLMAMCGAKLIPGIDVVLDELGFTERCESCDLVITGEGRLDDQSLTGKACMGVAKRAKDAGVPTVAIVGATGSGWEAGLEEHGGPLADCLSLTDEFGEQRAMNETVSLVERAAERVVREMRSRVRR